MSRATDRVLRFPSVLFALLGLTFLACGGPPTPAASALVDGSHGAGASATAAGAGDESTATDADDPVAALLASSMADLIARDDRIELTAAQEEVKRAALTAIPAPCCSDNTAYTCCCPCNLARAWWGLSKALIVEHGQGAAEVQRNVEHWIENLRPEGFAGDACYTGRCTRAAKDDGCSGMNPTQIVG